MSSRLATVILFFFFLICGCASLHAQKKGWHLKGKITGRENQELSSASISVVDGKQKEIFTGTSDTAGFFYITSSGNGTLQIVVSYAGYRKFQSKPFEAGDKDFGTIMLVPVDDALKEVTVVSKPNLITVDGGSIVYNVAKSISSQGTNAFEALQKAPGVFIDNNNNISLNGKQGAMVMLDGRQTYLSSTELVDLLRSMPASSIRSIELINSPTAKYDASGSAGIINIRTIKSTLTGFSGSVTAGISYGVILKQNTDLSFNYRKGKLNVFGGYNHFIGDYKYLYGNDRIQKNKIYNSFTDDTDKRKKMGSRLGIDYNLDKKNTIGLLLNGNFLFGGGITDTRTSIRSQAVANTEQTLDAVNDYYYQNTQRYNVNLNYKYEDSLGRILNIDADYGSFVKDNKNLQSNIYRDNQNQVLSNSLYRSLNSIDVSLRALRIDYTANLGRGKLETGAKFSTITTGNDARFFRITAIADSVDERRTNQFRFQENISSGYINYKTITGKWVLQAGLRVEHTASTGTLEYKENGIAKSNMIKRDFTNLFPSASVSVKPGDKHNFSLSYSRRIDRPAYQDLNPFIYLLDELSYWQGDPFLLPQMTHRLALQYVYKNTTIISLGFAHTDQFSTKITDTLDITKIVIIPRNLGVQKNLSLSLTQVMPLAKGWDAVFNGTLYQVHNIIAFDRFRNFNLSQIAARMNLQQTIQLKSGYTLEVTAMYVTGRLTGANESSRGVSQVDLGLQKNLWKNKGTLRLVFADIYKGSQGNSIQQYDGFYLRNYSYYETRQVRLNFTYKFADNAGKGPRNRSSALENENSRVK
jgi:hypothetical protein